MLGGFRKTRIVSILCLPKASGCQLLEAATSVGCRFRGSSQTSNALDRLGTLQGFRFDVFGVECLLWVKSGQLRDLFDQFVGPADKRVGDVEAERFCSLHVDNHLDLRDLLDRQIGRLFPLEYSAGVDADLTGRFREAASIAHQAAGHGELAKLGNRGHRMAERQRA